MIIITLVLLISKFLSAASVDVLKNDFCASNVGMAGSKSAVEESICAINYNPAGIAFSDKREFHISVSNGFEDASYSYTAFGTEIKHKILSEFSYPKIAASVYLSNLGDITIRNLDNYGNISEKSLNAEKDIIFTLGYAEKLSKETVYLIPSTKSSFISAAGVSFKYINSKLLEKYSATTFTFDAGYMGKLVDIGLNFGFSVSNTLGKIKYIEEKTDLPVILRAGVSYSKPTIMENKFTTSLEFDRYLTDSINSLRLGIDYTIENSFSFRTGYRFLEDNKGLSIGIGIYASNFSFDIATVLSSVYKYSFFTIGYRIPSSEESSEKPAKSKQIEKFKEKQKESTPPPPSSEKLIIVF